MTDAEIIKSVLAHKAEGWTELVKRHGPAARAVARVVFERYREPAGAADLDEVVVEVFQRLAEDDFQWFKALTKPELMAPSLRALAAWRALGLLRTRYHTFTCSLEAEVKLAGKPVATAMLARPPADRERAPFLTREDVDRLIEEYINGLGERQKRLIEFRYHARKNYREIAAAEGIPLPSVGQILRHERDKLAVNLAAAAPEAEL